MLTFTLLRLAFVFTVADLTHAVTLIGTGVASASRDYRHGSTRQDPGPLVQQPAASDIPHTTDSGFNTSRLGHRLPTGTALSHAHGTTFITLAAMYRAVSPTISTKINTTTLDIRLAARLGVRRCKRDAHDSHCARNACGYISSLYWLLDTRGRDDPDTHSLSLPTSGSLPVRLPGVPGMATAWSAGGQDIAWVALPSDRPARGNGVDHLGLLSPAIRRR